MHRKFYYSENENVYSLTFEPSDLYHEVTKEKLFGETKIKGIWHSKSKMELKELMNIVDPKLEWEVWENNDKYFELTPLNISSVRTWCNEHPSFYLER